MLIPEQHLKASRYGEDHNEDQAEDKLSLVHVAAR